MNIRHPSARTLGMVAITAIAFAVLGGCKNPEAQVVGTWTGGKGGAVTFKADKTFAQTTPMAVTGKWSLAD
jgi:hypothetical protein